MFKDWKVLLFGLVVLSFCFAGCRTSRWLNPGATCNGPGCGSCADGSCAVNSYSGTSNSMASPGYNTGFAPTAAPSAGSGTRSYGGSGTR